MHIKKKLEAISVLLITVLASITCQDALKLISTNFYKQKINKTILFQFCKMFSKNNFQFYFISFLKSSYFKLTTPPHNISTHKITAKILS